jgi:hypothetical protein
MTTLPHASFAFVLCFIMSKWGVRATDTILVMLSRSWHKTKCGIKCLMYAYLHAKMCTNIQSMFHVCIKNIQSMFHVCRYVGIQAYKVYFECVSMFHNIKRESSKRRKEIEADFVWK